ncbi:MAG TPA: PilZ domain-containing protein [Candidatus Acidoferrales bacterium]
MATEAQVSSSVADSPSEAHHHCSVAPCERDVVAELDSKPLCVEHFLTVSMNELEERARKLTVEAFESSETTSFRDLISSCAQQAHRLSQDERNADTRIKARLLDIFLRASQLGQSLRRSPRVESAVSVYVRREESGRTWEEETWTSTLSLHGAGLSCRHLVEKGGLVILCRKDKGERARARVVYCRYDGQGRRQIGVEFLDRPDFWDFLKQPQNEPA